MAVRLSVIMVHSAPAVASAQRLAESIVGELIGRGGIDLTLVAPFSQLSQDSTDRLTLDSLIGDVAVLDWQSPASIVQALEKLGFDGQRSAHAHDPDVTPVAAEPTQRRVYALDLNRFSQADEVVAALSRLQKHRQVKTFSLGPLTTQADRSTPIAAPITTKPVTTKPVPTEGVTAKHNETKSMPPVTPEVTTGEPQSSSRPESLDLDQLLDDLDQIDP